MLTVTTEPPSGMNTTTHDNRDKLLPLIQEHFPLSERPFRVLGEKAGMSEDAVIDTVRGMIGDGSIRTFGPVFEAKRLGYTSTLAAAEVEESRVAELAAAMLDINEITHNYLRENRLNLWFTVTARSEDIKSGILRRVGRFPGVSRLLDLPVVTVYKIRAVFGGSGSRPSEAGSSAAPPEPPAFTERGKAIVRALQADFPVTTAPYAELAAAAGVTEEELIGTVADWQKDGTIRRFGARLNHRKAGYTTNTLAAWKGGDIDVWGGTFAELPEVSHCYRRATHPDWPWELYTMVHARSDDELSAILARMRNTAPGAESVLLKTLYELKKTSMRYFLET